MIATVIGSTGLTGSILIRMLLDDAAITKVISISRRSLNLGDPKLSEVLVSDLADLPSIQSRILAPDSNPEDPRYKSRLRWGLFSLEHAKDLALLRHAACLLLGKDLLPIDPNIE